MVLHLRLATDADADGIGRVGVAAFAPETDPIARAIFPAHLQPATALAEDPALAWRRTRKGIKMRTERIVMLVVTDDELDDQVVGFAMWEAPLPEGQAQSAGEDSHNSTIVECETLDVEKFKEMRTVTDAATDGYLGKDGCQKTWYLDYLGVHPDQQRRGIGRMLLNWGVEKAREENKDAFLIATPAGFPLYKAAGWEDMGSFMLFGEPHNGMIIRRRNAA